MKKKDPEKALKDAELRMDLLHLFAKYGLVNEIALRNSIIRKEHLESKLKVEKNKNFMERTALKYFISEKSVDHILYGSQKSRNNSKGVLVNGCEN